MATLAECLSWNGQRVWVRTGTGAAPPVIGTIVHAFPTPFESQHIDLAVRLKDGTFTVVMASARGIEWDFESKRGQDHPERKSAA